MKSFKLNEQLECAICQGDFEAPCDLSVLACNACHVYHADCLAGWINFNKAKRSEITCPLCRKVIDESKIAGKKYTGIVNPQDLELQMTKAPSKVSDIFAD